MPVIKKGIAATNLLRKLHEDFLRSDDFLGILALIAQTNFHMLPDNSHGCLT